MPCLLLALCIMAATQNCHVLFTGSGFRIAMSAYTIYHNPRCSKSRQTLQLLQENGVEPEVVLYLESPPDRKTLQSLLQALDIPARQLLRKGEDEYKALGLADNSLSEAALLDAMLQAPKLIERPIVIKASRAGARAVLGRPPENVLALLED